MYCWYTLYTAFTLPLVVKVDIRTYCAQALPAGHPFIPVPTTAWADIYAFDGIIHHFCKFKIFLAIPV